MKLLLWCIPHGLLATLLYLLFRRHAYRAFPWFFAYVAYGVTADLARILSHGHPRTYFAMFWLTDAGYAFLGALAMYELLRKILRPLSDRWWTHSIFPSVVAVGVALSIWRMHAVPPQVSGRFLLWIVTGEIAIRFVQVLVVPLTLIPLFGRSGYRYSLGIAAGFGLYSTIALLITTKLSDIGTRFTFSWGVISLVTYSLAVLIWIWSFSVPQQKYSPPIPEETANILDALNQPRIG